ncbi:TonB-dependent receptor plug [Pedobacter heparinus DSM 2366]|uniref:TonB-dependent receptor plug n=2 Tax=Pedobacter heparinus TaxID=984 RepID=C6Y092_PEDHD|nr:TonB-dependent receptor plug [Pedobacter heparinus DSM 2366]
MLLKPLRLCGLITFRVIISWVLLMTLSIQSNAQSRKISGKVTSDDNEPLFGVTVFEKGTKTGATTDADGKFVLTVSNANATLSFRYVGYQSRDIPLNNRNTITLALKALDNALNEIVVVGYGTTTRKDLTGAVGQVKMNEFEKAPVKSFDEALAGRVAGVQVSGADGQPGEVNTIVIRGAGSITQDNSPLYVVDGFPLEDANNNSINPADIESIDILKDASATAIYGARGANGVIIITTKRGKADEPVIAYNGYYGFQKNTKTIDLMNPYEFVKYQLELDQANATTTYLSNGKTLEDYRNVKGLDFQDQIYRNAPMQSHDISLRGGSDKTRYSISANIIDQNGVILNSDFRRYQGRITLDQNVNRKLKVGVNLNYSYTISNGTIVNASSSTQSASTNLLYAVWGYRPVTGNDNNLDDELFDPGFDYNVIADYRVNPVISAKNELRRNLTTGLIANAYAEYKIIPSLTLRVTGGITNNMLRNESFYNSLTQAGNPRNSSGVNGSIYYNPATTWLNENTLTYKKIFNKVHNLTILGGYTMQGNKTARNGFNALNVPNELLGLDGLDESPSLIGTSLSSRWGLLSYLGRINYNYNSKYYLTASFRSDGSSKFAPGKRWGYFPSGAFSWRMSGEEFMKKLKFVSEAKLRLSYGETGNNRVGDFPYLDQITQPNSAGYSYGNGSPSKGAILTAFGNASLRWETTKQVNIGYDLSLFKQRINLTVDLYKKTTHDLLLQALLPYTTGLSNAYKNIGKMQNNGLEITLNTVNINGKTFSWNSNFNISFNKNKVLALAENQTSLTSPVSFDQKWNALSPYIAVVGQAVGQLYGAIWDGVYQYEDFDKSPQGVYTLKGNIPRNGNPTVQPGDIKYKDINGDGNVNASDFTVIGRGLPVHTGGLSNNFIYKGFDLNVFLQWSYGNDIINANRLLFEGNGKQSRFFNQYASYANRWQPDNPSNTLFRTGGQGPFYYSSRVVEDGSYLRLKTISLGYNVPVKIYKKANLKSLRIYASAQNIATWTNYSGPDPEVSVRNSTLTPGFDFSAYPRASTLIFGLNLSL